MLVKLMRVIGRDWWLMAIAAMLGSLAIGSNMALLSLSAYIISAAALHPPMVELSLAITGVRFFGIARAVCRYFERYVAHIVTFRVLENMRVWFYRRLEPLAPARLAGRRSGELLAGIVDDIETLKDFYLRVMAPVIIALLVLSGVCSFFYTLAGPLIWVLLGAFFLVGMVVPVGLRMRQRQLAATLITLRARLKAELVDTLNGIVEVAACGQAREQVQKIQELRKRIAQQENAKIFGNGIAEALSLLVMNGAGWLALWYSIPLVREGRMQGVYMAVVLLAVQSSFEAVMPLSTVLYYVTQSKAAAGRLFSLAELSPAISGGPGGVTKDAGICVQNLFFRYLPTSPCVLNNISFQLPQGGKLAIVGPSGAGKSTLINILLRFWEYEQGVVQVGGRDIREYQPEKLRDMLAVVSQQTHIFNASLRDNILLAKPDASTEEVAQAVRLAGLETFIQALPEGDNTMAGHNGHAMSGGERQRISIARALLKNAPILLLDEPTTGLDAVTEHEVMGAITNLLQERTVLWITHRLKGLEKMDCILVLQQGCIVEQGSYEELLASRGLFYHLWELERDVFD